MSKRKLRPTAALSNLKIIIKLVDKEKSPCYNQG